VLLASGSLGLSYSQRIRDVDSALSQGRALLDRQRFHEAREALQRGLALAERVPGSGVRRAALARQLALADRGVRADELHQIAELIRYRYGLELPPIEEAQSLIRLGRVIWQGRHNLLSPVGNRDEPAVDDRTQSDLTDLMVLWADLRGHLASGAEAVEAKEEALRVLTEAAHLLGNNPALERERRKYAAALGLEEPRSFAEFKPRSAREHFDLGKSYLRSGDSTRALEQFHRGAALRPQDFWLNFYEGLCAYRLEHFEEAVGAFRVAIALSPSSGECYYNRGLAYQTLGRLDLALADYDRALELNENFADAALNRGVVRYRLGRHSAARRDLDRALALAPSKQARGVIHYNLALIDLAVGNRKAFAANLQKALELENPDAKVLKERLQR
jgi:tetratricopeptide (TPR) repeat protein